MLLTTHLFAAMFNEKLTGEAECYWCGAPCKRLVAHNQPTPGIGTRRDPTVKRPGSAYVCLGCQLFQRPSISVQFLHGVLRDRQSPPNLSWWMTDEGGWGIEQANSQKLYELLLKPPIPFSLSLLDTSKDPKIKNRIHCSVANDPMAIQADNELHFTLNNQLCTYNVFELETALDRNDVSGMSFGVRALVEWIGPYDKPHVEPKVGRPKGHIVDSSRPMLKRRVSKSS